MSADVTTGAETDVVARLQRIEDRQALTDLVTRYCIAVDDRDLDAIIELFSSDARMGHADGSAGGSGHDGIHEYYEARLRGVGMCFHYPHAQLVEFASDDEATGVVLAHAEMSIGEQLIVGAIRYHDEYVRERGTWRFRERRLRFFYLMDSGELAEHHGDPERKRWPGPPETAELPDSLETYQAFRARVG